MFSGFKLPRAIRTYPPELGRLTTEIYNKQHARKNSCPFGMLWIEIVMYLQPESNKNRVGKGEVKY